MTTTEKFLVQCLKCALNKERIKQIPNDIDFKGLYKMSVQHSVVVMVYYALEDILPSTPEAFQKNLQIGALRHIKRDEITKYEQEQVLDLLEENSIDHLPLKGFYIKDLYPTTEMRFSSDTDILVKPASLKQVHKIFANIGYIKQKEDAHHDVFYNPTTKTIFEIHKSVFAHDLNKHFTKNFEKAYLIQGKNHLYSYNENDLYISIIAHYAYHFNQSAGVGLRAVCDIEVMRKAYKGILDENYINDFFEKCGLKTFYNEFIKLVDYLFYDMPCDDFTIELADYLFTCSLLENKKYSDANTIVKEESKEASAKSKAIIRKIFPKKEDIYFLYPWIKKVKILLPLGYILRWFKVIFKTPKRIKVLYSIKEVKKEELEKIKYIKSGLGLGNQKGKKLS